MASGDAGGAGVAGGAVERRGGDAGDGVIDPGRRSPGDDRSLKDVDPWFLRIWAVLQSTITH